MSSNVTIIAYWESFLKKKVWFSPDLFQYYWNYFIPVAFPLYWQIG